MYTYYYVCLSAYLFAHVSASLSVSVQWSTAAGANGARGQLVVSLAGREDSVEGQERVPTPSPHLLAGSAWEMMRKQRAVLRSPVVCTAQCAYLCVQIVYISICIITQ